MAALDGIRRHEVVGLMEGTAHHECDGGEQRAHGERNSPAPRLQLIRRQKQLLKEQKNDDRAELTADERDILETGIEAAMLLVCNFTKVRRARAVFPAEAQPLNHA